MQVNAVRQRTTLTGQSLSQSNRQLNNTFVVESVYCQRANSLEQSIVQRSIFIYNVTSLFVDVVSQTSGDYHPLAAYPVACRV